MKTLIKTHAKQNIQSIESFTDLVEVKSINVKTRSGFKFYQTLFITLLTFSTFLIFPESPQDSDILCKKYNSNQACIVW